MLTDSMTGTVTRLGRPAALLATLLFVAPSVRAESDETLAAAVQDEPRILPQENMAFVSKTDRRIRFQVMNIGDARDAALAGTVITVVNPEGDTTKLRTDSQGTAVLTNVSPGVHAVVTAGSTGHAAIPLVVRPQPEMIAPPDADPDDVINQPVAEVKLPVIRIDPAEVVRVANSFLPPPTSEVTLADIDDEYVSVVPVRAAYRYRIPLRPGGRIEGRVFSALRPGVRVSVGGTNVMVFSGNRMVARAISDDAGRFAFENLRPGVHGLIAAGPAGYAAFAFEILDSLEFAESLEGDTLISAGGDQLTAAAQPTSPWLPVVLIPSPFIPDVLAAIQEGAGDPAEFGLDPIAPFAPIPGGGFAGGAGGGVGGGAGIGGGMGLLGVAGIGAAAAAAASRRGDRGPIFPTPPVATPAAPGPPSPVPPVPTP